MLVKGSQLAQKQPPPSLKEAVLLYKLLQSDPGEQHISQRQAEFNGLFGRRW